MINIDEYFVGHVMQERRSASAGPDGIPNIFYGRLAGALALLLTIVFQQSIHQEKIPDVLRIAHIIHMYKGTGNRS